MSFNLSYTDDAIDGTSGNRNRKAGTATRQSRWQWSRRITDKHRLVYEIHKDKIDVLIVNAYGHYNDK